MKTIEEMESKIIDVLSVTFDVPKSEINRNSSVENISNWDSINHMNMVVALEEEFMVEFKEEEFVELISFELICSHIKEKLKL